MSYEGGNSSLAARLMPDDVRDFLRENPSFIAEDSDLLSALVPPARHKAEDPVQDFQHYMLTRLQDHITAIKDEHNDLLDLMQEHLQRQNKINSAILALLDAEDFESTIACASQGLADILDQESVVLFFEAGDSFPHGIYGGAKVVAEGFADKWLGEDRDLMLEEVEEPCPEIFGAKASLIQSQALVRLHIDAGVPNGLLALGHSDPMYYGTGLATEQIECLGCVLERCVRRWLRVD